MPQGQGSFTLRLLVAANPPLFLRASPISYSFQTTDGHQHEKWQASKQPKKALERQRVFIRRRNTRRPVAVVGLSSS